MTRRLGRRGRSLDIIVIYHGCPLRKISGKPVPARERSRPAARLATDLQQYRQDVAGLPRDRALKHNESSSIHTRERRTRPSS
ncbi:hypothetical protein BURCENBC7_AP5846 [Burkholderia cenocepacia BC7]|nr:hypothetical protein BURCENK562V_C5909 [Burkholderia cenocepacia K56-2Valvano]ERI31700.1 hypothetical protein BURCENBC7_AP5846 [Burkholderia cenocepacia BC7]PNE61596.1 hypothetical protein A8H29_30310 [Burkholderia cenocepacia]